MIRYCLARDNLLVGARARASWGQINVGVNGGVERLKGPPGTVEILQTP
jgi:hypothetical protein